MRSKFVAAYEGGNVGLKRLAATFQVSLGWAEKVWRAMRQTGQTEQPAARTGVFLGRLTPAIREQLEVQIDKRPDATVNELREWRQQQTGVENSQQRLSAVIPEMGIHVKRKAGCQ